MAIRDANGLSPSGAVTKELDHKQHEVSREQAGAAGSLLVSALLPGAAFVGWVFAMNRVATPAGGAPATPAFYRDISLVLPAVVTALYTAMCLVGPRLMCNRQPIELKGAMLVYNLYQTLLSIWSVALFIWEVRKIGAKPWGNTEAGVEHLEWVDQARYGRLMWVLWLHYNNKYVELLDSVFMILRKKTEQLSFLHCYHHALLIWCAVSPTLPARHPPARRCSHRSHVHAGDHVRMPLPPVPCPAAPGSLIFPSHPLPAGRGCSSCA